MRSTALELESRRRILRHVCAHPGLHLRQLAAVLAMPVSTLEYHCHILERQGHLAVRTAGKFKAFFPPGGLDRRDKDLLYVLRRAAPRRVVATLLERPGATAGELGAAVGLAPPSLSFHLRRLREAGLVREERDWRTKHVFLEDPERAATLLATFGESLADPSLDPDRGLTPAGFATLGAQAPAPAAAAAAT